MAEEYESAETKMKTELDIQIDELERQLQEMKRKLAVLRRQRPKQEVRDYRFKDCSGQDVPLSNLFGDRDELILIHNMGQHCSYCTMWADGFNGLLPHLMSRAAFVVVSPDEPQSQSDFAKSRGWNFPIYSARGTDFIEDMGFGERNGELMPGVSTFEKTEDGRIYRTNYTEFGPGDDYCATWHLFDLLTQGVNNWEPKISYWHRLQSSAGCKSC